MKWRTKREIKSIKDFKAEDLVILVMIFLLVGVVPLIVSYGKVAIGPEEMARVKNLEYLIDLFSYWKKNLFLLSAGVIAVVYLLDFITNSQKFSYKEPLKNPVVIAALVYMAAVVLSTLFSEYKHAALFGVSERYEGAFVLLGYMVVMFALFDFTKGRFQSRLVLYGLAFSAVIIGIIGAFQVFGINPFFHPIVKFLVYGSRDGSYTNEFTQVYSTLYNPNCVGMYTAMLLPVTLITAIFYDKKRIFKYVLFSVSLLMLVCLVGCRSAGGLVALVVDAAVVVIFTAAYYIRRGRFVPAGYLVPCLGVAALLLACAVFIPTVRGNLTEMANKLLNSTEIKNDSFYKDMSFDGNRVDIISEYGKLSLMFDTSASTLSVIDKNNAKVSPAGIEDGGDRFTANYSLEGLGDFRIELQNSMFAFVHEQGTLLFIADEDGTIYSLSNLLQPIDPTEKIPSLGFVNMERWGSGRGYIWSRTFPLLPGNIILGSGPDSFVFQFPQRDVSGKMKAFGNPYTIVDKPHNLYMQVALNTGIVSLLALLFIFGYYIVTTFLSLIGSDSGDRFLYGLRLGILTGVCGYLTSALATDSVISVAPLFWALLGMGFALNALKPASEVTATPVAPARRKG